MNRISWILSGFAALLTLGPSPAAAQCADGSPPPCRTQQVATAPRRVNPPLDDRTWIVVPFDNLAKVADIDWMRDASVNLLYLDMSRWKDIRVIDDERVADLLRETPEAKGSGPLALNAALAVARRAGAGRLVMGDLLKVGSGTRITAKVYDARTGQRIRSVSEATTVQDSVIPLFGRLAQRVLNVAPPQGANVGAVGTSRVDAYQEYIAGVSALNHFDLVEARQRLARALELDSTFALAHFKMAQWYGWAEPGNRAQRAHAQAAARLMAGLPARERGLITGQLQSSAGDWTDACQTYLGLYRADSLDVEALYGLGDCLYHDQSVAPVAGDTTRFRFRGGWDRSIRAFRRVLELDPQYHLAYQHIVDGLAAERHQIGNYCVQGQPCRQFAAYLLRRGDSLIAEPVESYPRPDTAGLRRQAEEYTRSQSRRHNLDAAQDVIDAWIAAAPNENRARLARAGLAVLRGQLVRADSALAQLRSTGSLVEDLRRILWRMEVAYKLGRMSEALAIYDSVRSAGIPLPGQGRVTFGSAIAAYGPAFGRIVEFDSLLGQNSRGAPPLVLRYQKHALQAAMTGVASDSLPMLEALLFDTAFTSRGARSATANIAATLSMALRMPRRGWPALDTSVAIIRVRPAIAASRGDTAGVRLAARALDSLVRNAALLIGADSGFAVVAADAYLLLGDTASALASLRLGLDSAAAPSPYFPLQSFGSSPSYFAPRMMLMRADLAAARGLTAEARIWYERFVGAWGTAAAEFQPVVQRARESLARLSARP